ncbi:hypothetical protein H5410_040063 [Solanum commersonii]|uniref:Uncharacterized protein n=1 Tax=Solanum commersonii TaxID=4109 RepID=A0A9J5XP03_SOLCO|nr:hypothetical protein H5410_040063 [Solanum commersonii]
MEKSSRSSSDLLGEEKSNENSNENSREKEKDDESDGDKLSREKKVMNVMEINLVEKEKVMKVSAQSDEKEEDGIKSSPDYVKIISNGTYKFKTNLNVCGFYDSRINARVDFGVQFVEFRKILIAQNIENDLKKSCFGHFLKLNKDAVVQLPMKLVHGLNLRHIFSEKKKEVWIDYNGLSICFGINEFAIGL